MQANAISKSHHIAGKMGLLILEQYFEQQIKYSLKYTRIKFYSIITKIFAAFILTPRSICIN